MCHQSCSNCLAQDFASCSSCNINYSPIDNTLCQCSSWLCVQGSFFQPMLSLLRTLLQMLFFLLMICYIFRIKLILSYRFIISLQTLSFLMYSKLVYLGYADFHMLQTYSWLSGYLGITSITRLKSISIDHTVPTLSLVAVFLLAYLVMYKPINIFYRTYDTYLSYLKQTWPIFLSVLYYFSSRQMYFFIGMFLNEPTSDWIVIIFIIIFSIIILGALIRTIYQYHYGSLNKTIFTSSQELYCLLSPAFLIMLPLISTFNMIYIIFLGPIGLLILITLLNRNEQVFNKSSISFWISQIVIIMLILLYLTMKQQYQSYILVVISLCCLFVISIEINKIHPEIENISSNLLLEQQSINGKKNITINNDEKNKNNLISIPNEFTINDNLHNNNNL